MADIRINSLPSTATSTAADDFFAIDGTTNGTRKMSAFNPVFSGTSGITTSDVIFGSAGPSAKSSIAARAARQGLVFNGTTGATVANLPAIGTGDYSYVLWLYLTGTSGNDQPFISALNAASFGIFFGTQKLVAWNPGTGYNSRSTSDVPLNKWVQVAYTRSGTTGTYYINGVADNTITDSFNYTTGATDIGSDKYTNGTKLSGLLAYNRALSAAEVVALYEAGVPAGADYPTQVAGTALLTGNNSTFASGTGTWQAVNGGSIVSSGGVGVVTTTGGYVGAGTENALVKKGIRYRLTFTSASYTGGVTGIFFFTSDGTIYGTGNYSAGTYTVDFTAAATSYVGFSTASVAGSFTLDNVTLIPLGLLLAPDAGQAGGGLTWYDTSGNAANITLPASGVSWNVPFAGYLTAPASTSLTLNGGSSGASLVLGQGTNGSLTLTPNGTGQVNFNRWVAARTTAPSSLAATSGSISFVTNGSVAGTQDTWVFDTGYTDQSYRFKVGGTDRMVIAANTGNFLLNTTTDSGNGKLQLATHTTSAGGIGLGTIASLYTPGGGSVRLESNLGYTGFTFDNGGLGTSGARILSLYGALTVSSNGANSFYLQTGGTTALTLDSSQRCILAGALRLNNAYTAGAPTATGYVTIQDSAGNTYKVLVGT